jgi:hypothetical protein
VAPKADQPSRKPINRWTTKEMAHLILPNPRTDPEAHQVFMVRYHEATGYDYDEKMPLNHALTLITGLDRASRAWARARRYLAYGIPTFPQRNRKAMRKAWVTEEVNHGRRPFSDKESDRYLNQYKDGLTSWPYLHLAGWLAQAKESLRAAASKRSLGENLGVTPARRQKEQAKNHRPENN